MKSKIRTVLSILCIASLGACGTVPGLSDLGAYKTGTHVTAEQMASVMDKVTTQTQIVAMLGQPNRKADVDGKTVWYYDFNQIGQALIGKNINETTGFEFNKKGVVLAHYKTGGQPGTSNNALLKAAGQ